MYDIQHVIIENLKHNISSKIKAIKHDSSLKKKNTVECRLISFLLCASKITFIFCSSLKSESELSAIWEKLKISQFKNSNHTSVQSFAKNYWMDTRLYMEFKDSRITQSFAALVFLILFWLRRKISGPKGWSLSKI